MDSLVESWLTEQLVWLFVLGAAILSLLPWRGWTRWTHAAFLAAPASCLLVWVSQQFTGPAAVAALIFVPLAAVVLIPTVVALASFVAWIYRQLRIGFGPPKPSAAGYLAVALTLVFVWGSAWLLPKADELVVTREWESVPIPPEFGDRVHFEVTAEYAFKFTRAVHRTSMSTEEIDDFYLEEALQMGWFEATPGPWTRLCKPNRYVLEVAGPGAPHNIGLPSGSVYGHLESFGDLVSLTLQQLNESSYLSRCGWRASIDSE